MTEPPGRAFPVRVAAIDAGSNAIRFVVADFTAPWRASNRDRFLDRIYAESDIVWSRSADPCGIRWKRVFWLNKD